MKNSIQLAVIRSEKLLKISDEAELYLFFHNEYKFCKDFQPIVEEMNHFGVSNNTNFEIGHTKKEQNELLGDLLIHLLSRQAGTDRYYWNMSTVQHYLFMKCEFKAIRSYLRSQGIEEIKRMLVDSAILAQLSRKLHSLNFQAFSVENSKLRRLRQVNERFPSRVEATLRDTVASEVEAKLRNLIEGELLNKLKNAIV